MAILGNTKVTNLTLLDGVVGNLNPVTTNVYDLGTSSLKWHNIYSTTFTGSLNGKASYIEGTNDAANPGGALLRSGSGRTDASPAGDTWIYWDTLGGTSNYWGIRHNQGANTIGFYGSGTERVAIHMGESKVTATTFAGKATSAGTADKLGTGTIGSTTKPIYLNAGVPTAINYTIETSVPSNAKFTDTNTWRPVQDNLTSSSSSDCLSAKQGKVLYDMIGDVETLLAAI